MTTNYLNMFKNLQISKEELINKVGGNLFTVKIEKPITLYNTDVINVLKAFKLCNISLEQLLDWVNTVWFTELFDYDDEYCDSIASVLDKLEDLDEDNRELSGEDINKYINALVNNKEV